MKSRLISSDPEILDGTPVFVGTRVPVKNLTGCLEAGDSIDVFLEDFPSVSRAQVIAFLEEARTRLVAAAVSAMRVMLDECLPRRLGLALTGHVVSTVSQAGWAGISNGKLLARISVNYDVFLTVDKNLPAQP